MDHTGTSYVYKLSIIIIFGLTGKLAFLALTEYYSAAFKTGKYPTIEKDQIVMWSRPHPAAAKAPDPVGPPTNFELVCHHSSPVFIYLFTDAMLFYKYSLQILFGPS